MRTATGAQTGKPRHEWQAGRTAQMPAAGPHHNGGRTHPYMRTSPRSEHSTPPHMQSLPQPPGHPAGKRGVPGAVGGDRGRWRARSRKGYGSARARRNARTRANAPSRSHPPNNTPHTPPATQLMQANEFSTPCATCRRTWSTPNARSGTVTTNPGDRSHGPQPGTESSHRPYRRRKYQTRRVLRYFCAVPVLDEGAAGHL